jgi:hypothetical protein
VLYQRTSVRIAFDALTREQAQGQLRLLVEAMLAVKRDRGDDSRWRLPG